MFDKVFGDVWLVNVQFCVGYVYELMNVGCVVQVQSQDGIVFVVLGIDLLCLFLIIGVSVMFQVVKVIMVFLGVDVIINMSYVFVQFVYVWVNYKF